MTALMFFACTGILALALSIGMATAWLIWFGMKNSGWVDTIWAFSLGTIGACSALFLRQDALTFRSWLVAGMALAWSLRLAFHIARRTAGITDDPRYALLIEGWGAKASHQMFWLLQKQAVVSIPLAAAMWLAARHPLPGLSLADAIGILVFLTALGGEAVADEQLRRFRAVPANRGRVCDVGLWSWSRHPNYFFEWLGWLAYLLLATSFDGSYSWGFVAFAAPACMYWLLLHVSGVPPLEAHMLERYGEQFRKYQLRTNAFFPGPPKAVYGESS